MSDQQRESAAPVEPYFDRTPQPFGDGLPDPLVYDASPQALHQRTVNFAAKRLVDMRYVSGLDGATAELQRLWCRLQPLATSRMRLDVPPPRARFGSPLVLSRVHWVRPELVVEVKFLAWTEPKSSFGSHKIRGRGWRREKIGPARDFNIRAITHTRRTNLRFAECTRLLA